jgi:hypothetical protein
LVAQSQLNKRKNKAAAPQKGSYFFAKNPEILPVIVNNY